MTTFRSIIVTPAGIWFDGAQLPHYPALPEKDIKDGFTQLVLRAADAFDRTGVLGVNNALLEQMSWPGAPDGWKAYGNPESGWSKLVEVRSGGTLENKRSVVVMNLDLVNGYDCPLMADSPGRTGANLADWHNKMGSPFLYTSGVSGMEVFERMAKEHKTYGGKHARRPAWKPEYSGMPWAEASEMIYSKNTFVGLSEGKYLHGYDSNRHYLAAAGNAVLHPNVLGHTGRIPFDKKLAGWWLVDVPPWNDPRLPHPAGGAGLQWITTATVELLHQLAEVHGLMAPFDIEDSFTGKGQRVLYSWAQRMEKAYQDEQHNDELKTTLKDAMRSTLGLFNSPSNATYRPDWWQAIVGTARANLFRKMLKAADSQGMYPYGIETDCVYYRSDNPDPWDAIPDAFVLGTGLGQFKVKQEVSA